jgi:predicted DsbA family dithiol-disulfide isomerase
VAIVKLTYYLDVQSSWCLVSQPALERLRREAGDRLDYDWRIAILYEKGPMGYSRETCDWYYRRTASITGTKLNADWHESSDETTVNANLAAEAARGLGVKDDRVRLAIARAAMIEGEPVATREACIDIAARAGGLDQAALGRAMDDPATMARIDASSREFDALGAKMRPTWVFSNDIDDFVVLSGLYGYEPAWACFQEMWHAADGVARFNAANPIPVDATR